MKVFTPRLKLDTKLLDKKRRSAETGGQVRVDLPGCSFDFIASTFGVSSSPSMTSLRPYAAIQKYDDGSISMRVLVLGIGDMNMVIINRFVKDCLANLSCSPSHHLQLPLWIPRLGPYLYSAACSFLLITSSVPSSYLPPPPRLCNHGLRRHPHQGPRDTCLRNPLRSTYRCLLHLPTLPKL